MAIDKTGQSLSVGTEGNLLVMVAPASILTAGKTLSDVTLTRKLAIWRPSESMAMTLVVP